MFIRHADVKDVHALTTFLNTLSTESEYFRKRTEGEVKEIINSCFGEGSTDIAYVVTNRRTDSKIIGYLNLRVFKESLFILNISVLKDYLGHGIANKLLDIAVNECVDRNIGVLELMVHANNSRAIAFYLKSGFTLKRKFGSNHNYYKKIKPK